MSETTVNDLIEFLQDFSHACPEEQNKLACRSIGNLTVIDRKALTPFPKHDSVCVCVYITVRTTQRTF